MMKKGKLSIIISFVLANLFFIPVHAQQYYPASFDIATLNGTNGFRIPGIDPGSQFGAETKFIGDINNDGFEDIALGVNNADINGLDLAGAAYIIFGSNTGFPDVFDITTLDGTNGFAVEGLEGSTRMGDSVEGLGDINGDDIDDLAIGSSGDIMVIYGKITPFNPTFNIDYADGVDGFLIQGANTANEIANLGDINGDDIDDFAIGRASFSAAVWVIFGRSQSFPSTINASWLDGNNGFAIERYSSSLIPGFLVGGAGDINSDGYQDIIVGDWSINSGSFLERTHLLYGRENYSPRINLETSPTNEVFTIDHTGGNFLAFTGGLGDVNNDGIDDFFAETAAIFGRASTNPFPSNIPLASVSDGTYGFILPGQLTSASIGDVNQDGIDDFISCYRGGSGNDRDMYVVFGSTTGFPNPIDDTTLNGLNGFIVPGFRTSNIGRPVSGGGDFNGDGIADFIMGSPSEIPEGSSDRTGEAYVVFGGDHYTMPLNNSYPQAINETTSGFTLVVNGPEAGTIHFAVYPGNFSGLVDHNDVLNGTGSTLNGDFLMNLENTDVTEVISSLAPGTTYDVYLFLEDASGNRGEIYHINDVTTLSNSDTEAPTASNPSPIDVQCSADVPDPDIEVVTDEADNSGEPPVVAFVSDNSDGNSNPEIITRTYSVTDEAGNSINVTQTITINDTANPTASDPASISAQCSSDIPSPDPTV
ncbi:integrin alpha, partial [Aquimarina sp. M1]